MISPEQYERENKRQSYVELLSIRDNLLDSILKFEKEKLDNNNICSSSEEVYQFNLKYLSIICSLLAKKYNSEFINLNSNIEKHYLFILRDYLMSEISGFSIELSDACKKRLQGKSFSFQEHIKGLVYAQLTPQQNWNNIVPHLPEIDEIFFYYEPDKIKAKPGDYFTSKIREIRCGNRTLAASMNALTSNINVFEQIQNENGSIDKFLTSDSPYKIVKSLSSPNSIYKLKQIGEPLAWEYLRNVGIDGAKPDEHLRRFLGADRMGSGNMSPASIEDTLQQVESLSMETDLHKTQIDKIIWTFCSNGNGEICTKTPHCDQCCINKYCKYNRV